MMIMPLLLLFSRRGALMLSHQPRQALRLLATFPKNDAKEYIPLAVSEIDAVYNEITNVNGGKEINVNSPKQVSQAIFGSFQSTSRKRLLEAASSKSLDQQKRALATLVLKYRAMQSTIPKRFLSTGEAGAAMIADDSCDDELDTPSLKESVSFEETVEDLFGRKSKVHQYWKDHLLRISKPSARALVTQLNGEICPMGYDPQATPKDHLQDSIEPAIAVAGTTNAGKRGSLLAFVREEKLKFQECIMLVRVGEFYESYGIDALMLMEHCGLNAMAGKCRAGCPVRNIQATLDGLTSQGLKVAVYEEAKDTSASSGPTPKSKLKNRMLGQVVSSASPSYLYDLVLLGNSDSLTSFPESRPYVGVIANAAGYTMVEVAMEERSVRVSERLTPEAVSCRLTAFPPVDPLIYVGDERYKTLPFLSSSNSPRLRIRRIPSTLVETPSNGTSDVDRAKRIILRALLGMVEDVQHANLCDHDFTLISSTSKHLNDKLQTSPIHVETATQLGLMGERSIPSLVNYLVPDCAPAACRRFLRRWLLTPPPPSVSDAMANLVDALRKEQQALPPLSVPPVGKVVALLRAGQASAPVFGEILSSLDSTIKFLHRETGIDSMMTILQFESGIAADPESIHRRCSQAIAAIEDVLSSWYHVEYVDQPRDKISDFSELIPRAFFDRNEGGWRGRVRPAVCEASYRRVESSALNLVKAIAADYWGVIETDLEKIIQLIRPFKNPVVHDVFNNQLLIREVPSHGKPETYFHPRDRNGKILRNRYMTSAVQNALSEYVAATEEACLNVASALARLSETLCNEGHLPAIVQSAHFNLILATVSHHVAKSNTLGWSMAKIIDRDPRFGDVAGSFRNLWPYWMDKGSAINNSFDLDGMFLLTAPNMSGKSTVMRATAAACLLSICGFCAPLEKGSVIRRFDHVFVRGASSDVPSENLSAFGAEVLDVSALLRCCSSDSLVFVDELGRGTSPRDGTGLAAAVVEAMAEKGMSGVFATHLHEIFCLPLRDADRVRNKRMSIVADVEGKDLPTFLLEDGICTDSLALVTAERFGFPAEVLSRAQTFANILAKKSSKNHTFGHNVALTKPAPDEKSLNDAVHAVSHIHGLKERPVMIPPEWNPPPSLEGSSCVYILALDDESRRFYVGETDSLSQRLRQHRAKGGFWSKFSAAVYRVKGGKTESRFAESLVIQVLASRGFNMVSIADGY